MGPVPYNSFSLKLFIKTQFKQGFTKVIVTRGCRLQGHLPISLGATIFSRAALIAVNRITRIRLFSLFFLNGCPQTSRFPTAGRGERNSGNEIGYLQEDLLVIDSN